MSSRSSIGNSQRQWQYDFINCKKACSKHLCIVYGSGPFHCHRSRHRFAYARANTESYYDQFFKSVNNFVRVCVCPEPKWKWWWISILNESWHSERMAVSVTRKDKFNVSLESVRFCLLRWNECLDSTKREITVLCPSPPEQIAKNERKHPQTHHPPRNTKLKYWLGLQYDTIAVNRTQYYASHRCDRCKRTIKRDNIVMGRSLFPSFTRVMLSVCHFVRKCNVRRLNKLLNIVALVAYQRRYLCLLHKSDHFSFYKITSPIPRRLSLSVGS